MILLDGHTLHPTAVARVAREQAPVKLAPEARKRNAAARDALDVLIAAGEPIYGVTTGVGALRDRSIDAAERAGYSRRLLRSHACGAGRPLSAELVRAAMVTRANQIGAGGAGVSAELLDALVATLNAGLTPFTRELGSLGTGDLTALADIGLALLGEGQMWRADRLVDAASAIADASIAPASLGPRDGLAFISSNAVSVGHAALIVADVHALLDAWLTVAALSFEAAAADPIALDPRIHAAAHRAGQSAALIAARVSALLDPSLTGLPPFLAERPGPESGALVVEYTAHAAAAEVRSLVTPVAAQTVSVSRGVESHSSLAPIAARRAHEALDALRVLVATELVVAVRALRVARHEPVGAGSRPLFEAASRRLDPDLRDRPLHPDIEAARILIAEGWEPAPV